ncbi:MAG: GDSL-type esterase/lipase family protein [Thermoanaerobaculia bacterium]|nr:GDSL-type esterase/lipase family protein [Thermoanaerobaculia bacterium]
MSFPSAPRLRGLVARIGLAVASTFLLLAVLEGTLRLSGFEFHLYPTEIEFGRPDPVLLEEAFRPDPELFWVTPGYRETLAELAREQPSLVLMGDSCTQLGHYDEALADWALDEFGEPLRYGNLAVAGWSTFQGRRQLARDVPALEPEVVTLYFGWNDHWTGFGFEDAEVASWQRLGAGPWGSLRMVQLVLRTRVVVASLGHRPNRVSIPDFRGNLRAMVSRARSLGAVPVLLPAPDGHRRGEEPAHLEERWLRDLSELVPLHDAYMEAVRSVARETGAPLCDLAARVEELPWEERSRLFLEDGIHFTAQGDRFLAREIGECFLRHELWSRLIPKGAG